MYKVVKSQKDFELIKKKKETEQKEQHQQFLDTIQQFQNNDSKHVPIKLLLHFHKKGPDSNTTDQQRIDWLTKNGFLDEFNNLFNRIYNKSIIKQLETQIQELYTHIQTELLEYLTPQQNETLEQINELLISYTENITKRTKKTKEQFSIVTELLSKLISQTGIHLHTFLNIKYKISIILPIKSSTSTPTLKILAEHINTLINNLSNSINSLELENTFIKNTSRNLDQDLYTFINIPIVEIPKFSGLNWSKMTTEQHTECLDKFSHTFFEKYPNGNIDQLIKQLVEWYTNKTLVYRNIKWNKIEGKITEIRGLSYDKTTHFYTLRKQTSNSTTSSKQIIDPVKLNNLLLGYIRTQKKKYNNLDDIKYEKQHFFNHMKTKLEVTLGKKNKEELWNQLNKMHNCLVSS